ncbi:helix-turn-helix domain-containing protein [Paenibacillus sp. J5C_2022]|uniref:helix-turn-helix domain-containing protein n=1 Tax=Paenibacillus sp. J5C2022 TaxID=2977129 RepID=UPI0021D347E0|nr:helix-turn-helix domain-containing protein [Paenibacillus sp. J5C2022]MCU6708602.1 helix-turn-helix domain-containing protein [Paenibacillus sp. J5C2022]
MGRKIIKLTAYEGIDAEAEGHYRDLIGIESTAGPHTHDFFEFFLIVEGVAYHWVNGKKEQLQEGTLVFMRPQDIHYYEKVPGSDFRLINLSFYEHTVMELFSYLGEAFPQDAFLSAPYPTTIQLSPRDKQELQRRLEKLYRIPQQDKGPFRTELRALLAEVYCNYMMQAIVIKHDDRPEWFLQLCKDILYPANFHEGVPAMLRLSGKSHAHLCRLFKQWEQLTPLQYLNRIKLQYAENLLLHSDWSILDIALEAGFSNLGHFYKCFKALYGTTPHKYRKLLQAKLPDMGRQGGAP